RGGSILTQEGEIPPSIDATILSALAAGSFAATRELALRVGETEFSALHQQGRQQHILMSAVNSDAMLMSVFGPKTTLGLVRFYGAGAVKKINAVLEQAGSEPHAPIDLGDAAADDALNVFEPHHRA